MTLGEICGFENFMVEMSTVESQKVPFSIGVENFIDKMFMVED